MKSSHGPLRRIVNSLRQRVPDAQGSTQIKDTESRISEDSFNASYDSEDYRNEALGGQDLLLPDLLAAVKDYQLTHGSLIKLTLHPATARLPIAHTVLAQPIGVSLVPTIWPEELFHEAWDLQPLLQELYAKVASDPEYIWDVLKDCMEGTKDDWSDEIVTSLWKVYESVQNDLDGLGQVQEVELGLCRGDWMLNIESSPTSTSTDRTPGVTNTERECGQLQRQPTLKQVELNTIATAGISHSHIVSNMHKHLLKTGIYSQLPSTATGAFPEFDSLPSIAPLTRLAPNNNGIQGFATALAKAHSLYGPPKNSLTHLTAVLMVVEHNNVNIADERPIEYALWNMDPPIPCFRCEYRDIMTKTTFPLTSPSPPIPQSPTHLTGRELIFTPYPSQNNPTTYEISVIYHRGSLNAHELSPSHPYPGIPSSSPQHTGLAIRVHLERSRAIKCPSILGQLAASKLLQQHLSSVPGAMERYLSPSQSQCLRDRCMPMSSLADLSNPLRRVLDECVTPPSPSHPTNATSQAIRVAIVAAEQALKPFVLKPIGAEGGGHCVFGEDIVDFYTEIIAPKRAQRGYVLMRRIQPSVVKGAIISQRGYFVGDVVGELGILGCVVWKRNGGPGRVSEDGNGEGLEILANESVGWTLKSKSEDVMEMSVIKGYGCFDTPCLVDWECYMREANEGLRDW